MMDIRKSVRKLIEQASPYSPEMQAFGFALRRTRALEEKIIVYVHALEAENERLQTIADEVENKQDELLQESVE